MTLKLFEDKSAKIPDKTALTCNRADELSTMANNLWAKFCFPTDNSNSAIPLPATTWNNYPLPFPVPNPVPARRTEDASAEAKMFLEWLFKGIIAQLSDFDSKYSEEFDFNTTLYWQSRQVCPKCNYVVGLRSQTNYGEYVYNIELPVIAIGDGRSKSNQIPQPLMKLFAQTFRKEIGKSRRRINCENKCLSKQKPCKICVKRELCSRRNNSLLESKAYDDYKIGHAPAMLVIHLDRDRSKASGQRAGTRAGAKKNHLAVSIPEVLDITELLDPVRFGRASKLIRYKLNAMISHRGKDLAGGQYVSWTEKNQDCSWYKLSDDHPAQYWETIVEGDGDIPEPSFADVYAAGTEKLTREEFGNRETPVLLFYRRDFENERVAKGREPRNKDEGEYLDQEPREKDEIYLIPDPSPIVELSANTQQNWQMLKNPADRLRVEFKMTASGRENTKEFGEEQAKHQDERVKRMENTQATMKVSIKIGDKTYECHGIDVDLKRHEREDIDISITASHTVQIPDGQTGKKAVQIDLVDAYHDQLRFDEDVERKLQTEKKKLKRRREQEGVTGNALNYRLDEDEKAVKRSKRKLVSSTERDKEWADRWYNINENLNYTR